MTAGDGLTVHFVLHLLLFSLYSSLDPSPPSAVAKLEQALSRPAAEAPPLTGEETRDSGADMAANVAAQEAPGRRAGPGPGPGGEHGLMQLLQEVR